MFHFKWGWGKALNPSWPWEYAEFFWRQPDGNYKNQPGTLRVKGELRKKELVRGTDTLCPKSPCFQCKIDVMEYWFSLQLWTLMVLVLEESIEEIESNRLILQRSNWDPQRLYKLTYVNGRASSVFFPLYNVNTRLFHYLCYDTWMLWQIWFLRKPVDFFPIKMHRYTIFKMHFISLKIDLFNNLVLTLYNGKSTEKKVNVNE